MRTLSLFALTALAACGATPNFWGGIPGAGVNTNDGADDAPAAPVVTPLADNGWTSANIQDIPADVLDGELATGFKNGDLVANVVMQDQNGEDVELYQFYGQWILLDMFAEWCGPCQAEAPHGEEMYANLKDDGFVLFAAMQDADDGTPTVAANQRWTERFELTHPVLADANRQLGPFVTLGYPTFVLVGPDMRVVVEDMWPVDEATIASYVLAGADDDE